MDDEAAGGTELYPVEGVVQQDGKWAYTPLGISILAPRPIIRPGDSPEDFVRAREPRQRAGFSPARRAPKFPQQTAVRCSLARHCIGSSATGWGTRPSPILDDDAQKAGLAPGARHWSLVGDGIHWPAYPWPSQRDGLPRPGVVDSARTGTRGHLQDLCAICAGFVQCPCREVATGSLLPAKTSGPCRHYCRPRCTAYSPSGAMALLCIVARPILDFSSSRRFASCFAASR